MKKKASFSQKLRAGVSVLADSLFFLRNKDAEEEGTMGPSWRFRRKLIYGAYRLGFGMVIFGAVTYSSDTAVGSGLVAGGVSLISIILTAYTATATFEDVKLWQVNNDME